MQASSLLGRRAATVPAVGVASKPVVPTPRVAGSRQVGCNVATGPRPSMTTFTGGKGANGKPVSMDLRDEGTGLFTSTNPELRRVVPENVNGRTMVKVVYVVLEAQYQSALSGAVKNINAKNPKVCIEVVGYLLEELRDAKNFAAFKADMETANVFIGSLIFIEELAEKASTPPPPKCP
ncbi:Magnesium-chelatase subunit ChlH, chloroplastic, partial [Tetrabaena socialis]